MGNGRRGLELASMRLSAAFLAAFFLAAPAHPQSAAAVSSVPDLLRRALAAPASSQLFAYDFMDVIEDKDGKRTIKGRIDPSRRKGDRVTITFLEDLRRKPANLADTDKR